MKKVIITSVFMILQIAAVACEVCKRRQPKVLRGITHGAGPQSEWDYVIVGITSLIVMVSLYYSIKWMVRPGEQSPDHIKHSIFNPTAL